MKRQLKRTLKIVLGLGVIYLIVLAGGFFGVKKGLTNTAGIVDERSSDYGLINSDIADVGKNVSSYETEKGDSEEEKLFCKIDVVEKYAANNALKIIEAYQKTLSLGLVNKMIFAVQMRFAGDASFNDGIAQCVDEKKYLNKATLLGKLVEGEGPNAFTWINDEEWHSIKEAAIKDEDVIRQVAKEAQVPARLIVSNLIVEQLRLFHSQRELFKKVFEPLKILGNATKISLGVMGIKEATAIEIENHLKDPMSPYYLGKSFENKLDFSTEDPAKERFERLTREKDHYYSYLYAALYLKQIMTQWEKAGYDIKYRPEIIGTLFNVGFPQSKPKSEPKVGGSEIAIKETKYSFGSLAYEFYYSGEMEKEFPFEVR